MRPLAEALRLQLTHMSSKLAAVIIALYLLNTFLLVTPVQAHFTPGDLTGTIRYHANDFDPHVSGLIGYI